MFERIVSEGISHNSYLIGSGGSAAVIDPRRDCDIYLEIAGRSEMSITHIFEHTGMRIMSSGRWN